MSMKDSLRVKLQDKTANVAILGLGYVGLPLAVTFAEAGFRVVGGRPDMVRILTSIQKVKGYRKRGTMGPEPRPKACASTTRMTMTMTTHTRLSSRTG